MTHTLRIRALFIATLVTAAACLAAVVGWRLWGKWQLDRRSEAIATLAAKLANDKCERYLGQRLFRSEMYRAELRNGRWHWGEFEPEAAFSAEVSLADDGSDPKVQIHWLGDSWGIPLSKRGFDAERSMFRGGRISEP